MCFLIRRLLRALPLSCEFLGGELSSGHAVLSSSMMGSYQAGFHTSTDLQPKRQWVQMNYTVCYFHQSRQQELHACFCSSCPLSLIGVIHLRDTELRKSPVLQENASISIYPPLQRQTFCFLPRNMGKKGREASLLYYPGMSPYTNIFKLTF